MLDICCIIWPNFEERLSNPKVFYHLVFLDSSYFCKILINILEFAQNYPRPVLFLSQQLVGILAEDICQDLGSLRAESLAGGKRGPWGKMLY